jgi:PAS domain S-box-containing protein
VEFIFNKNTVKAIWEKSLIGMALVDKEGLIKDINPKFCRLLGYTHGALINKHFREITHPDDYYMDSNEFESLLKGDISSYEMFKRYITKSGEIIGLKLRVDSILREDGEIEIMLGQVSDTIKIIPLEKDEIKHRASEILGEFLINNWKLVIIFFLIILGGSTIPEVIKYLLTSN